MQRIGRYKIVKEIGRGAMGIVYLATDPTIGRSVAIKTVRLRDLDNAQQRDKLRERLFREARSAGVLSHPNIVTIYDMAEEDGVAYIAMEYVDGPTLEDILESGKPIDSGQLFGILRQTATAIDYAHSKGIIHRDIKPANIMLSRDGAVKVTDFGIAKINAAADSFTVTGTLVGTPNYMSPEQVQGHEITGRSDQFSLAVVVYEILTGERPFPGEQISTVVYKIVAEEPAPPQRINPTLSAPIHAILKKALSKKPENRYKTCAEFIGSLETTCAATRGWRPMARGVASSLQTVGVTSPGISLQPPVRPKSPKASDSGTHSPAPKKRESKLLPMAAAVLMAAGVFFVLTWRPADTSTGEDPAVSSNVPPALPKKPEPTADVPATGVSAKPAPSSQAVTSQDDKPSAMGPTPAPKPAVPPPAPDPAPEKPPLDPPVAPPDTAKIQHVVVSTNPPGARATLDGAGEGCITPCVLEASQGAHSLNFSHDGYMPERRDIRVLDEAMEYPLIRLRRAGGMLMLSSVPTGASITINGKLRSETTPAQLSLSPGSYVVMVEKDGHRGVDSQVEVRNGTTNFVKIPLQ